MTSCISDIHVVSRVFFDWSVSWYVEWLDVGWASKLGKARRNEARRRKKKKTKKEKAIRHTVLYSGLLYIGLVGWLVRLIALDSGLGSQAGE